MSQLWWSEDEARALILSVGGGRQTRPLSPVEVAQLFERASRQGATANAMAEVLHLDASTMIGRFLSLNRLPPSVQRRIGWGKPQGGQLNLTQAQEIARLSTTEDQEVLASAASDNGMSAAELRAVIQLVRNAKDPLSTAVNKTLAQRPQIERRYVTIGQIRSEQLKQALARLDAGARVKAITAVLNRDDVSARLEPTHFSITSSQPLGEDADQLEKRLNDTLEARILR